MSGSRRVIPDACARYSGGAGECRQTGKAWLSSGEYEDLLALVVGRAAGHFGAPAADEPRWQREWWMAGFGTEEQRLWRIAAEANLGDPSRANTLLPGPEALHELDRLVARRSEPPAASDPIPGFASEPGAQTKPQPNRALKKDTQTLFNDMIAKAEPLPDSEALSRWAKEHGIALRRLRDLRKACPDTRLHKRGRRPANPE
jgi:hypothetical protein